MTGAQVVRAAIVRQMNGFSYEALAFHLQNSATYSRFFGLGLGDTPPSPSALASNIKKLGPDTWEAIHRIIIAEAVRRGVDDGRKVRIDTTPVASPIHKPDDASLLWDVVRVLARNLAKARAAYDIEFSDRRLRAKRRMRDAVYARKSTSRRRAYADLLKVTIETLEFVPGAVERLQGIVAKTQDSGAVVLLATLQHFEPLGWQVVEQTFRRVDEGEKVPVQDKIVSIFEPHTDILVKDRREVHFGHKVCVSTGPSSLVLDCQIFDGNPADSTLVEPMLQRHREHLGRVPRQVAMDGGFASQANLELAKAMGVKDVAFHKRRNLKVSAMAKSSWVYKRLVRFRAGVEAGISWLKRGFGMDRSRWRGRASFHSYVWAAVVTLNLVVIARHALG